VLLAAAAAWRSDGLNLAIVNPSEAFTKALALFGARFDDGSHKELLA
jgi:anti-anti-sigma regulatory factor